jgi:hypothetical protein
LSTEEIPAGSFSDWLGDMQAAIDGHGEMDVPCGECNACCRAAYFIQVEADETQALAAIPPSLLFPAPGDSSGKKVMGFSEQGHCPMLGNDLCTIYDVRPRTCRVFDCRVFAATDIFPDEAEKAAVSARARRWVFSHASDTSRTHAKALQAAGRFLRNESKRLADVLPRNATQLAVLAVRVHDLFVDDENGEPTQLAEQIRARISP